VYYAEVLVNSKSLLDFITHVIQYNKYMIPVCGHSHSVCEHPGSVFEQAWILHVTVKSTPPHSGFYELCKLHAIDSLIFTEEKPIIVPLNHLGTLPPQQYSPGRSQKLPCQWMLWWHTVGLDGRICTFFTSSDHFWELDFWLVGSYCMQHKISVHCTCRLVYFSRVLSGMGQACRKTMYEKN